MTQDFIFWALAVLATFLAGVSKGGLPMVGILAVPTMSLNVSPTVAAGLLLPLYVVSDIYGLALYRREYNGRNLAILAVATTIGVAIGWAAASITSDDLVKLIVGLVGLSYCGLALVNFRRDVAARPADVGRGLLWGTLAGFTSFVSHAGGPPYQMYVLPQKLSKMIYAGTTTILFTYVNLIKLPPYWMLGQINVGSLKACLFLAPVALFGAWAGYRLTRLLPEKLFFRLVEAALFLVSIKLIWDAVPQLL